MSSRIEALIGKAGENRALAIESLTVIAAVSLLTSWAIQPYVIHALVQQGTIAQGAAQAALWLSGVLSPFAAFGKAAVAALVCWSCAIFLEQRVSVIKLLTAFCVAEVVFSIRDLAIWGALAVRGVENVHSTADLMLATGLNAFVRPLSPLARMAVESWDFFTVAWAIVVWVLLRTVLNLDARPAARLAALAFVVRTLFAAASLLYSV
jgi:ABC-type uncharacterized transport system permease subunit